MSIQLIHGDCLDAMKQMPDDSVDSVITDPPYELGFMGKSWDSTGIANNVEMWSEVLRVLKPGGHLLAFGGTRTYHRMACAIEDTGFEVRDMIEWIYGSGFPKSLNIGKAVDKLQGNEREVEKHHIQSKTNPDIHAGAVAHITMPNNWEVTKGNSKWEGWGTALKPAHEPICMARKPLAEKTVAENCLKYGTGGINIDVSRVEYTGQTDPRTFGGKWKTDKAAQNVYEGGYEGTDQEVSRFGRFPANLIHDNSEEIRECFPETKTGKAIRSNSGGKTFGGENIKPVMEDLGYDDNGGNASRFFKSIIYQAKASKSERGNGNNHPTVKPISLMEYLIKMVTPKNGTVLDPFMGSGSTGVAAKKLGYDFIGIEMDAEYVKIAEARISNQKFSTPPIF